MNFVVFTGHYCSGLYLSPLSFGFLLFSFAFREALLLVPFKPYARNHSKLRLSILTPKYLDSTFKWTFAITSFMSLSLG